MEISVTKTKQWIDEGKEVYFLDVRTNEERALVHIGGLHIPLPDLEVRLGELDSTKRPWVVYCHHGVRSLYAAQILKMRGFDALSLAGGLDFWSLQVDVKILRY